MPKNRPYKLQRFLMKARGRGTWTTIKTSVSRAKIMQAFRGWKAQLISGGFRVRSPGGRVVAKRDSVLSRKLGRKTRTK